MAFFVWTMLGLALWHFTVFLPDNFLGGIVGAFVGALLGSLVVGTILALIFYGGIPGQDDTTIVVGLLALPGAALGMGLFWWLGVRQLNEQAQAV